MITHRSYHEMMTFDTFVDRFEYLKLDGKSGAETFGEDRYLNQMLYQSTEWKTVREKVILRDRACDLAHPDYEIRMGRVIIHHINPLTPDDILEKRAVLFDLDNLVTMSFNTHRAIHYGDKNLLKLELRERKPNDTCLWKGGQPMITYIIGLPGAGKTTLAKHLIGTSGGVCYDMDYMAAALSLSEPTSEPKSKTDVSIPRKLAAALRKDFLRQAGTYTDNIVVIRTAPSPKELMEAKPDRIILCNREWVVRPYKYNKDDIQRQINTAIEWAHSNNVPVEVRSR